MALPPEDLDELLPETVRAVTATVEAILATGPLLLTTTHELGWTGPIDPEPWQLVRLRVHDTLRGRPTPTTVEAYKPVAPYTLEAGVRPDGTFLLGRPVPGAQGAALILGRYGPTAYPPSHVPP